MTETPRHFACVVAADLDGGIGKHNDLPWPRLKTDLRFLKTLTVTAAPGLTNAVVMGRRTWDSVPATVRPLPGRVNVVISRAPLALDPPSLHATSLDDALAQAGVPSIDRIFVIGGGQIYAQAFDHPLCRSIYLTRIHARFDCDAHIPPLEGRFVLAETLEAEVHEQGLVYSIGRWDRA